MTNEPTSIKDLENPKFLQWLKRFGMPLRPDEQDFDWDTRADNSTQQANQYRLAKDNKMLRLYREWESTQN